MDLGRSGILILDQKPVGGAKHRLDPVLLKASFRVASKTLTAGDNFLVLFSIPTKRQLNNCHVTSLY